MTKYSWAFAITWALAITTLSGCDRITNVTEEEHIQRAKDFEDKGNLTGSIIELKNAIQKNPDSPQARLLLGQIYLKDGRGAEAEKELTTAKKLGVSHESIQVQLGEALLLMKDYKRVLDEVQPSEKTSKANLSRIFQLRGDALLNQGKLSEACNLYQQSLDNDGTNSPTYWGLAQCAIANNDLLKAEEWLNTALKIKNKQATTWIFKGDLNQLNNKPDDALVAYTNALKVEPHNLEALQSRATLNMKLERMESARIDIETIHKLVPKTLGANYLQALLKYKEKKFPEARNASQEALKIAPDYLPALLLGGSIEYALGNFQTAESYITKVLRATPKNSNALGLLATIQLRQGRADDAAKTLAPINMEKSQDAVIHAIAGEIALSKKDFAKAAAHFETAAQLRPRSAAIRAELGRTRLAQGDARAMDDFQAAAALDLTGTTFDSIIILNQLNQKQFDAALSSINSLEKKQPQSPLVWNYRGTAYLGKKEVTKAREHFLQALKLDPQFFPAAANLAQLDLVDGQPINARKRFENIIRVQPEHTQALLALADISLREKDERGYMTWLEKAAKADPHDLVPRMAMTEYFLSKGEKIKAVDTAREAVNASPGNLSALKLLGNTQLVVGDKANAISTFTTLTKKANQSPDAYLLLANAQIASKKWADARTTLERALQVKPTHLLSQDALLRLEMIENKPERALQIARQIQVQAPHSPLGFEREADIYHAMKHLPQATIAYGKALDRGAGSANIIKLYRAHIQAGNAKAAEERLINWLRQNPKDNAVRAQLASYYMSKGRDKEAITQYLEIQRHIPNNAVVLNNLANLYQRTKDKRALTVAEQALKIDPNSPAIQDTLGWILVEQGQTSRGLDLLNRALTKVPKNATIRYHHSVALARTGNISKARSELVTLLKDNPTFPEANEAKDFLASLPMQGMSP